MATIDRATIPDQLTLVGDGAIDDVVVVTRAADQAGKEHDAGHVVPLAEASTTIPIPHHCGI